MYTDLLAKHKFIADTDLLLIWCQLHDNLLSICLLSSYHSCQNDIELKYLNNNEFFFKEMYLYAANNSW